MYSTMFPEDCGTRDLFHFHLSQPRNISSLDKIKSMFCRFKKNSLVTSNVIYLIFTNIKSCNFFPCYFHWSSDMYTLMYLLYILCVAYSVVFSYRSDKGNHLWKQCTQMYFLNKDERNPFCVQLWNAGLPVWEYSKARLGITQKPRNQLIVGSPETLSFKAHRFRSLLSLFFYFAEAVNHTSWFL